MSDAATALANDLVIDITTTGAKSGEPRRLEIWFHRIGGKYYITGSPGARGWYANLLKHPQFTLHFKETAQADLAATARPITGETEKRQVFQAAVAEQTKLAQYLADADIEDWIARSPLIEFVPAS